MSDANSLKIPGVSLEKQNWQTAKIILAANPVVVFPLGATAIEHGPNLPLNTDTITANWLAEQIRLYLPVVIAPIMNASFYPAFVEYAGSISLRAETARDIFVDSCRSLAVFGAKRFYVLNNGLSTAYLYLR
jgi:creatinine amidohydrolase